MGRMRVPRKLFLNFEMRWLDTVWQRVLLHRTSLIYFWPKYRSVQPENHLFLLWKRNSFRIKVPRKNNHFILKTKPLQNGRYRTWSITLSKRTTTLGRFMNQHRRVEQMIKTVSGTVRTIELGWSHLSKLNEGAHVSLSHGGSSILTVRWSYDWRCVVLIHIVLMDYIALINLTSESLSDTAMVGIQFWRCVDPLIVGVWCWYILVLWIMQL